MPEYRSRAASDVLGRIVSTLGLDCDSATLFLQNQEVRPTHSAKDLILKARNHGLSIRVILSERGLSRVTTRGLVIKEIFTTEETFVQDLRILMDTWEPLIRSRKLMSNDDAAALFKDIRTIVGGQTYFLDQLREIEPAFGSQIAPIFLDWSQLFTLMQGSVSGYTQVTDALSWYRTNKKFQKAIPHQAANCRGRDLASYLITPVQRMPRYLLFIRELLKFTPQSHPDFILLETARNQIERAIRRFDDTAGCVQDQGEVSQLQRSIKNGFVLMDNARTLITKAAVSYHGRKGEHGTIYLFHNLVFILKDTGDSKVKAVYDSEIGVFQFRVEYPMNNSYAVDFSKKSYRSQFRTTVPECVFSFDDREKEVQFFRELATLQNRAALDVGVDYGVRWENWRTKAVLPALVRPRAVALGHELYIFNGDSNQVFKLGGDALTPAAIFDSPAHEYVVTALGDSVVIFTGTQFQQLRPDGTIADIAISEKITTRRGTALSTYGRDIVLFAGKSIEGKQYFNDVVVLQNAHEKSCCAPARTCTPSEVEALCNRHQ
jgi:hypothetical protein